MLKTYKFTSKYTNNIKIDKIYKLSYEYKKYYNALIKCSIINFYKNGLLSKYLDRLDYSLLSVRYKQVCGTQVRSTLQSWLSNIGNRCNKVIRHSCLSNEIKLQLYYINKYHKWFCESVTIKNIIVSNDVIKLSRKIFKHFMFKIPAMHNCCMILNKRVAEVQESKNSYDYWIKLSTLEKGNVIYLPIKSYDYYNNVQGIFKNVIQIKVSNKIEYGFVKDVDLKEYNGFSTIGIDAGLVNLISSSSGSQYGKRFYKILKKYDNIIQNIVKNRMKQGLYRNSPKLNRLYNKIQNFVKNEIGRCLNRLIKLEQPKVIVVENIKNIIYKTKNNKQLNKSMRRLLNRSGFSKIGDRLKSKCADRKNIELIEVNPAYTSQLCPKCGYVHKSNRKNQAVFKCLNCGYSCNADYNSSINIRNRRSILAFGIYMKYKKIKEILDKEFLSRQAIYRLAVT